MNWEIKKNFIINVASSLLYQIITLICGLILPRAYLTVYGSEINGMISSINQFLSYIALLQAGVGGVVRAALYKPIAEHDEERISRIIKASNDFFRKIGAIFIGYTMILSFVYPIIVNTDYSNIFVGSLVIILSISSVFEYLFSITWSILLHADQKRYVFQCIQGITLILNTIVAYVLIMSQVDVRFVRLATAVIFVLRPILLNIYVKKHYNINPNAVPDEQAIKQKWDALGHHIAYFVRGNTDIFLASFFLDIKLVSVYAVYSFVVKALSELNSTIIANIESVFGNLYALKNNQAFKSTFYSFDVLSKMLTNIFFGTGMIMIIPFVNLYTNGVTDINYDRPVFAVLFLLSESVYCMGLVYNNLINATGKYKATKKLAFTEAGINFLGSLLIINIYGLEGIVLVTLVSVLYRCIVNVLFINKNILPISLTHIIKTIACSTLPIFICIYVEKIMMSLELHSYIEFGLISICVMLGVTILNITVGFLFFRDNMVRIVKKTYDLIVNIKKGKYNE